MRRLHLCDGKFFVALFFVDRLLRTQVFLHSLYIRSLHRRSMWCFTAVSLSVSFFKLRGFIWLRMIWFFKSVNGFADDQAQMGIKRISRRTTNGFNLIPSCVLDECEPSHSDGSTSRDARVCYTLPIHGTSKLVLMSVYIIHYFSVSFWVISFMASFG